MAILFDDARASTPPRGRSTKGLWISIGVHAVVLPLIVVTMGIPGKAPEPRPRPLTVFIAPVALPSAPIVTPRLPDPPPPPPVREIARAEVPKPLPEPIVTKAVEPPPPPIVQAAVVPERPIEKPVPQRPVETGLFERANSARTSQADAAITTGAFGNAAAAQRGAASGAVTTGGFGSVAPAARKATTSEVQTAGFDRANAVQPAVAAAAKPADRPVEIVFKPTPEYTDEARSARIEGTVSLELEFTAAGDVRVLRVVRGLGHGLDEAAQRAATRIRFKPAQSDGGPVDSRATVHITFRLS
jgi:TonB family protein